jgi:hypothetical protein
MAQMAIDKIPPGPKLDALTAEKVFGWKTSTSMMTEMGSTAKDRIRLVTGGQLRYLNTRPTSSMRIQSRDEWNSLGGWIDT